MRSAWLGLAEAVIAIHYAYLAYLIIGGFLAWRWRSTIVLHGIAALWAALIILTKVPCPLTALQNQFRENAGEPPLASSFINTYVRGTFYPGRQQALAQGLVAAVVLASWIGYLRRRMTARQRACAPEPAPLRRSSGDDQPFRTAKW